MAFQPSTRRSIFLAAVLMVALTSCTSHVAPLGPDPTPPPPQHLRSPFVLQALRVQSPTAAGACPAGSIALPGGPAKCYRKVGTPVAFTSAAVSALSSLGQGQGPAAYGFVITVPAADQSALTAVTTAAFDAKGYIDIGVASKTWLFPQYVAEPFTSPHFEVSFLSRSQVLELHRLLVPSG